MPIQCWEEVRDEAVSHLSRLIKFDTSNPPGNELPAANYLYDILQHEGIEAQVIESAPNRGNLIARLPGSGAARPLLLLSHLDVVPARADEWTVPPFSGQIAGGYVWGRGALDCKFLSVIQLMCLLLLKREKAKLKRDIILAATADEEAGGKWGLGWLVVNYRALLDCEFALNEGGGVGLIFNNRRYYLCQTAEKGICWFRISARGSGSHASIPRNDNPTLLLAQALHRLSRTHLAMRPTQTTSSFIEALAAAQGFPRSILARAILSRPLSRLILRRFVDNDDAARVIYAMLHDTATPTVLRCGDTINVIPSTAEAYIDGRIVPGQTPENFLQQVRRILGDGIDIDVSAKAPGFEMPLHTELYNTIREVIAEEDPGASVIPFVLAAGTDSKYLAAAGTCVYGFAPMRQDSASAVIEMVHGRDERISVENVLFGTKVLYGIVKRFCT